MKTQRNASARETRSSVSTAYPRAVGSNAPAAEVERLLAAGFMGIPESQSTPPVRGVIMSLKNEVESLRRELSQARTRLSEMERCADRDQLLPLLNRRAFVRELTRHIAVTGRYNTPASLIYFDMNYLKKINDRFGHAAGDAVLTQFANVLLRQVRDSDSVGRLGGDEFGVVLSHATHEQALKKAAALAEVLRASPTIWNRNAIAVSFAYGAFELKPGDSADLALGRADEAMYLQKRSTRPSLE